MQLLLFDTPRSASHLLQRILSKQPELHLLDTVQSQARGTQVQWLMRETWADGMSSEEVRKFESEVGEVVAKWRTELEDAGRKDETFMVHDHPFNFVAPDVVLRLINDTWAAGTANLGAQNFTMIPNDLLLHKDTVPILTIRDPRLTVPSAYRVLKAMGLPHGSGRPNFTISTSPAWARGLHDFYVANGIEPIVVDADDFMTSTDFVRKLCTRAGLDPSKVYLEWTPPSEEEKGALHPMFYTSQKTLTDSSGVRADRAAKNIDMEMEKKRWKDDFGEDISLVEEMIEYAMPHYSFLYEKRLKL